MRWFFYKKNNSNVPQRINKLFADIIKKESVKILLVFDRRGNIIYSNSNEFFFKEKDLQGLLRLLEVSEKMVTECISNKEFFISNFLHYRISTLNVKYGIYRIWLVKSKEHFLIAITEETDARVNIKKFENSLHKKLRKLEESGILEY